jgi:DNA-binding GntR family transcriptional regulator
VDGDYPVGSQLPTEEAIRHRFGVSRYTIREALQRLRRDNLVTSKPRVGTIVVYRPSTNSYVQDVMSIDNLLSWSADRYFAIDTIELEEIDAALAWTGLTLGESWLVARGFGYKSDTQIPHCKSEYFIHRDFAAVGRLLSNHRGPIFPLIEDMFGQTVVEVHQEMTATLIPPDLAKPLQVKPWSAGMNVQRSFIISDGRIAQKTFTTHNAADHNYSITLRRVSS